LSANECVSCSRAADCRVGLARQNGISHITWDQLVASLGADSAKGRAPLQHSTWQLRLLHERAFWTVDSAARPTYQPSLVTNQKVLEASGSSPVTCIVPIEPYRGTRLGRAQRLPIRLFYTIRLFDNGSATCTFAARLPKKHATFERIHWLLHLTQNVDAGDESFKLPRRDLIAAFLTLPKTSNGHVSLPFPSSARESVTYARGYCTLHDLFRRMLRWPHLWRPFLMLDGIVGSGGKRAQVTVVLLPSYGELTSQRAVSLANERHSVFSDVVIVGIAGRIDRTDKTRLHHSQSQSLATRR
jgi:hypothetical protein